MSQKEFLHNGYWSRYAEQTADRGASEPMQMVLHLLPENLKDGVLIDVGAGGGGDTGYAAGDPRIGKVFAVDPAEGSSKIINRALLGITTMRLRGQKFHFAQVQMIQKAVQDIASSDLPEADGITANAVMPYLPQDDIIPTTEKLLRMLKVGGFFVANYASDAIHSSPTFTAGPDLPTIACVTREELESVLEKAGVKGTVTGYGPGHAELKPGERPLMFEVIAARVAPAPLIIGSKG